MGFFEDLFEGGHNRKRYGHDGHRDSDGHRHGDDHHGYGDDRGDRPWQVATHGNAAATTRCPSCAATLEPPPGGRFCPYCGGALVSPTCRSCGAPAATGASFCQGCGQKL